jgi:hypothetical protein
MIDLRAPIARMLRHLARLLDDRPARTSMITLGEPRPPERPRFEAMPRGNVEGTALPGDRSVQIRTEGLHDGALGMPDILTYIDKETFDRMASRAREARDKAREAKDKKSDED